MRPVRALAAALYVCGAVAAEAAAPSGQASAGPSGQAATEPAPVAVRSGDHPGYGRIVIDSPNQARYQFERDGDRITIRFVPPLRLGPPPGPPRNVLAITTDGGTANLTVAHNASFHPARISGRIVFDVLDPPPSASPSKPAKPEGNRPLLPVAAAPLNAAAPPAAPPAPDTPPAPAAEAPAPPALPSVTVAGRPKVQAESLDSPMEAEPPVADPPLPIARDVLPGNVLLGNAGPIGLVARRARLPRGMEGSAFVVPFSKATGAAAFKAGETAFVVFDERRPVDMAALQNDAVFRSASVRMLPAGTLFQVPVPAGLSLAIVKLPQGWRIAVVPTALTPRPITQTVRDGRLALAAEQPSELINLEDPVTGAKLLVGTQHQAGQAVVTPRRTTEFILRPTIQGVVVEPLSDHLVMRPAESGFTLAADRGELALSMPTGTTAALADAAHLTRRLDLVAMQPQDLVQRVAAQFAAAAAAPSGARGPRRHAAAESMLALGLAAEAAGLLRATAEQDPREAASPDTAALTAVASLLAGRPDEADGLDDHRLDGTDEIAMWRAVRLAMRDEASPAAAAVLASTAPLIAAYPRPVADRILPLAIETMLQGGELAPAIRLMDRQPDDPRLAFARALRLQAEGETARALDALDALAAGRDQFDRIRAAARAIEIRLSINQIETAKAADALDKLLYAWRGDGRELALRERIADLRAQSGDWRTALAVLRQAEADFPEKSAPVHERLADMFAAMIRAQDKHPSPPLTFVAMVDENADLMPRPGDETAVDQPLAERLVALDLPDRALPVLTKLMKATRPGLAKARFGASAATLLAREGSDAAALAMLDESEADDPPADLAEQRALVRAGAMAHAGDRAGGLALLERTATAAAAAARAEILEEAKDWPAAERAWADCVALTVAVAGPLDAVQTRTVLRLATVAARAGDDAGLALLRQKYTDRVAAGSVGDMFHLLTAEPVRETADIQRAGQELNLAASLPAGLKALQGNAVTR